MLKIRKKQTRLFDEIALETFENDMFRHLKINFAREVNEKNDQEIVDLIRSGILQAEKYEVITVTDVRRYLECMVMLRPDFDKSAQTAWAGEILNQPETSGTRKMDLIEENLNLIAMEAV